MRCAIYARVSKEEQTVENQLQPLRDYAKLKGYEIIKEYVETVTGSRADREQFNIMLNDSDLKLFDSILVWSLDRFSREGVPNMVAYIERLKRNNVNLESLQERWMDISDDGVGQVLLLFMAWIAKQERRRLIERTKAGLVVARKNGKLRGRPVGAKDKGTRKNGGYIDRWNKYHKTQGVLNGKDN